MMDNSGGLAREAQSQRIKVLRLKHRDPEEVRTVLQSLFARQQPFSQQGGAFGGGGFMFDSSAPRIAVDVRTRSLIARGTEDQLETIEKVVSALDADPNAKVDPQVAGNLHVFRLQHVQADGLAQVLGELGIGAVSHDARTNSLIVVGSEAQLQEIATVITALDIPGDGEQTRQRFEDMFGVGVDSGQRYGMEAMAPASPKQATPKARDPLTVSPNQEFGQPRFTLTIVVEEDKDDQVRVGDAIVMIKDLRGYLRGLTGRTGTSASKATVAIQAPASAKYETIAALVDAVQKAGFTTLTLKQSDAASPEGDMGPAGGAGEGTEKPPTQK
jgi:biopolymer transport protein ExbD